ncbi:hypothetical protein [Flavobacterium tyrosinilyticum]|uniref:hypothetical protein n=1 Tax=Flavobacterium tyrosinilyticum TaxID=1658740 RepID=UPI002030F6D6|nr:hypothetical protein [Flavobacterium tyrosinilyticum]MCM0667293.1 hypothetical protein [Flavobacterium tyrosinilyticum]
MMSKFKSSVFIGCRLIMYLFLLNNVQAQQKVKKDTLYFKIDNSYLFENKNIPKTFFIEDGNGHTEFCFQEAEILFNLKPTEVLDLKYFIRNSKFFINQGKITLDIKGLLDFMKNYKIILIRESDEKTEYIKVDISIVIFD